MKTAKVMKVAALLAAGAMAVAPLAACGSSSSQGDTIEVWTSMDTGSSQIKTLQKVTDAFEKKNPGVRIKLVPRATSYEQDIKVRLAANNAPDIFNTHGWSKSRYANFLEKLTNRTWTKRLNQTANNVMRDKGNDLYSLPLAVAANGVLYNEDVLSQAGVDPKGINNWDDFMGACAKIKASGSTCLGLPGKENWWTGNVADMTAMGFYTKAQEKGLLAGKFDPKDYEPVLSNIKAIKDAGYINEDYVSASPDDMYRLMGQNKLAFSFQGLDFLSSLKSYNPNTNVGFMPYPAQKTEHYFAAGELTALGVSKTSKHKDQALKYIDFLAQKDNMVKLTAAVSQPTAFDDVPSTLGKATESYDYWSKTKKVPTQEIFDRTYLPDGMWNTIITTADGVVTGQSTPAAASDQMKTKFDGLYKKATK
ncbi:ABC transporter substrate-binding protein [Bifidobacterium sp. ESL0764]|uniref:ABC transporter substrate-binding protein n=1 Tax=Bifidobacterium sp. ESL0764 TaxID=2983228 RepID=UPI0023F76785|nr:ABC transporter substrate-binding protein [Bifidobacterium sp. ESL0764]WEV65826.1 ABC transporter substrate-binding protein [Bifidobacterium sp. ESL0764]